MKVYVLAALNGLEIAWIDSVWSRKEDAEKHIESLKKDFPETFEKIEWEIQKIRMYKI